MKGKERCRILKEIRARIAEENGIEFAVSECTHKGDCMGTCPKCESEVRYLERELERRQRLGKQIAVAGIAASITLTSAGCSYVEEKLGGDTLQGDMQIEESVDGLLAAESEDECVDVPGELVPPEDDVLMGEPVEIQGDMVAYFLPQTPEEYEGYDEAFISDCLRGENIETVRETWGEADMSQIKADESVNSYFTENRDIVIYFDSETGVISRAEVIENE
ncbi:MAG: hypothetical protein IJ323_02845 [Clostridia bacterium]|nr:hypothetical protein [Clostridia bacterium]